MGFKVGMISYVADLARQGKNKFVFDNDRKALAELLTGTGTGEYALRYLNGGIAVLRMNLFVQLETVEFPWVLTQDEISAWENGSDKQTPKDLIIFDGAEIPKEWWEKEGFPSERMLECA